MSILRAGGARASRRRRSPRRRVARSFATAVVTVGSVVVVASPVAGSPRQDAPLLPSGQASLRVLAQDLEVDADGNFGVYLQVAGAPAGSDLVVRIYDRIEDAEGLAASTTDDPADRLDTFDPIPLTDADVATQSSGFSISLYGAGERRPPDVPANWTYNKLSAAGVYPIEVRLRGPDEDVLTSLVTYLVRRPDGGTAITPADVALVATVHQDPPEPGAVAAGDPQAEAIDPTYALALTALLDTLADRPTLPVSFDVTPDVTARLQGDPDAIDLLASLRTEVGRPGRQLAGAPYVDIDTAELVANGLGDELIRQRDYGARTLLATLAPPDGWPGQDTWVIDRPIDRAGVDALAQSGVVHLVLGAGALSAEAPPTRFPLPGATVPVDALAAADELAGTPPNDPVLAGYQLLGRLAATASLEPGGSAAVVRIDPETVDAVELTTVLDVLDRPNTFLRTTTLAGTFAAGPVAATTPPLTKPDTGRLGAYPALVNETHRSLASYASMLTDRPELVAAFEQPLARSASADLGPATRRAEVQRQLDTIRDRLGAVSTPQIDRVTLGARNANFPLPITSTSGDPIKVLITLDASDRLSFPEDTIETTLDGPRTVVQIPIETRATGDTPLRITVRTPDGATVLDESRYTVRSTAVSGVGLLLTVGAAGFLALWWGRNWRRSRRTRRPAPVASTTTGALGAVPADRGRTDQIRDQTGDQTGDQIDDDDDDLFVNEKVDVTGSGSPGSNAD